MDSIAKKIEGAWSEKRFEPEMRNKDGMRYVGHRFPIKGGISAVDVMMRNISANNAFLRRLMKK